MIDPRYLSLPQWVDAVNLSLATYGPATVLQSDDWVLWAHNVLSLPKISAFSPPDPRGFSDWREWAQRFVECVPI